eukprot:TRINITY_DN7829_c0_g1_i1.p1 TRINITY_DN7829_c0_g1~~TRINITY_DN7829_c0_g1_i1.p1  ORF type:complete len:323 (-),score=54.45 TRINITY_DN7829_c0_g1_i1:588-1556(-)
MDPSTSHSGVSARSLSDASTRSILKWQGLNKKPLNELLDLIYRFSRRVAFGAAPALEVEQAGELPPNAEIDFWYGAFHEFFLQISREETDDLLFFVKNKGFYNQETGDPIFVRRNHPTTSSTIPTRSDPLVNWEESFFLNAVCNCFQYTLSFAVCAKKTQSVSKPGPGNGSPSEGESHSFLRRWRVIHCISKNVYATPSRQRMDKTKDDRHATTYPEIFFCIDDFEHIFHDAAVRNRDEYVCVEITARGGLHPGSNREVTIFQGAVGYDILRAELGTSQEALPFSVFKSIFGGKSDAPKFFTISGPNRKGKAQMALLPLNDG